jgi:hypothetical protein
VASPYFPVARSIFDYLGANSRPDGSIYDRNASSTLDREYHLANYVLGAVLLLKLHRQASCYDRACAALNYYLNLPPQTRFGAVDFSNFALLLSYLVLEEEAQYDGLKKRLEDYFQSMVHRADVTSGSHGNNFVTLRAVNHLLRSRIVGLDQGDPEKSRELISRTLAWQYEDGIFYDYPPTPHFQAGIPHLAYHAKISLAALLYGIIAQKAEIVARAVRAFAALAKLVACDGEAFYYGRSNNALYGFACGILGFRIAAGIADDGALRQTFQDAERALFRFSAQLVAEDGHLFVVPNTLEQRRCGFDDYMYVSVYNAFMMSMLLLAAIVRSDPPAGEKPAEEHFSYLASSGFVVTRGEDLSTCFNVRGHNCQHRCATFQNVSLLDPRLTCCTPLFLKYRGRDLLPSIPLSEPVYARRANESLARRIFRKTAEACREFCGWSFLQQYNPLHAGFLPYLEKRNRVYVPLCVETCEVSRDQRGLLVASVAGRLVAVVTRGLVPLLAYLSEQVANFTGRRCPDFRRYGISISRYRFTRRIIVHERFIQFHDQFLAPRPAGARTGFTVRTYSDWTFEKKDQQWIAGNKGYGFAILTDSRSALRNRKELCSSKGKVFWWDLLLEGEPVEWTHSLVPFDGDNPLEDGLAILSSATAWNC